MQEQVDDLQHEVRLLKEDNKKLNEKIIEILTEVKKSKI
jgi:predicted  nucleic acid-binding Zn-ribbon protein